MVEEKVWQIAAGSRDRDYIKMFYDWGIATIGPGHLGKWDEREYKKAGDNVVNKNDINTLRRFAKEVKPGNYIILKIGKEVRAIGVVEEYKEGNAYFWKENFKYVDGWELGHCIKVKWRKIKGLKLSRGLSIQKFRSYTANQKDIDKIKRIIKSKKPINSKSLYKIENLKLPEKLLEGNYKRYLKPVFKNSGTTPEEFWKQVSKLQKYVNENELYNYSEEEVKIFLIIPILNALGFCNKHIALEHKHIDILLSYEGFTKRDFNDKEKNKVKIIIESKRVNQGILYANKQSEEYLKIFNGKNLKYRIVSNGLVSYIYDSNTKEGPKACLDIKNLWIKNLPYDDQIKGAVEFIRKLLLFRLRA